MLPVTHPPYGGSRSHPKWNIILACVLCPVFLILSGYGLWGWFKISTLTHMVGQQELFYRMSLVIVPLVLFVFLSLRTAQKLERERLSSSYQMRLDQLQSRLNAQEDFVHSITDNDPESIAIFDRDNRYWFVNASATRRLGHDANDIIKKPLEKIVGHENALRIEKRLNQVRSSGKSIKALDQVRGEEGQMRFVQGHYEIIAPVGDFTGRVMVREEDVTSLIVERERRSSMLRQVIGTLVAVVDRRDPYAAGHSARVGQLSRATAEEMLLSEDQIDVAEIAGSLMNFGKVLVPREILTKATALTPEELQRVRDSILTSADILAIINFDGPVVPTLRQVMERHDGSGVPQGLKGDDILITARIVMVANAYVALVSPRAHRPSLDLKEALGNLTRDADRLYDRRVVVALANCIANHRDKLDWTAPGKQS